MGAARSPDGGGSRAGVVTPPSTALSTYPQEDFERQQRRSRSGNSPPRGGRSPKRCECRGCAPTLATRTREAHPLRRTDPFDIRDRRERACMFCPSPGRETASAYPINIRPPKVSTRRNCTRAFNPMRRGPPHRASNAVLRPSNQSTFPANHQSGRVWKLLVPPCSGPTRTDLFDFRQTSLSDGDQRERAGAKAETANQSRPVIRPGVPGGRMLEKGGNLK